MNSFVPTDIANIPSLDIRFHTLDPKCSLFLLALRYSLISYLNLSSFILCTANIIAHYVALTFSGSTNTFVLAEQRNLSRIPVMDRAISIRGMKLVQNGMGRTLFFDCFQAWGGNSFPCLLAWGVNFLLLFFSHGVDTFFPSF